MNPPASPTEATSFAPSAEQAIDVQVFVGALAWSQVWACAVPRASAREQRVVRCARRRRTDVGSVMDCKRGCTNRLFA